MEFTGVAQNLVICHKELTYLLLWQVTDLSGSGR